MKQNGFYKIGFVFLLSFLLFLSGCGSSSDSNKEVIDNTQQQATTTVDNGTIAKIADDVNSSIESNTTDNVVVFKADAGADQIVVFQKEFTFDGSKSTGDIVSYEWVFNDYVLNENNTENSTYTRLATQPAGVYTVTLKVTNSAGEISSDDVIITVVDSLPVELSVDQFKVLKNAGITYIDIRTEEEWANITPIEGSHKITYENYDIDPWLKEGSAFLNLIKDKNQEFVLICKGGERAKAAAEELITSGYSNVHWLSGGILAWNEAN